MVRAFEAVPPIIPYCFPLFSTLVHHIWGPELRIPRNATLTRFWSTLRGPESEESEDKNKTSHEGQVGSKDDDQEDVEEVLFEFCCSKTCPGAS